MASDKIRLFAVIIGINFYQATHNDFRSLRGAVPDALGFKKYLEDCLNVPSNQIVLLINADATRFNILDALKRLREDKRIDKGDAIFLYYAGHGTLISDLRKSDSEDADKKKIQSIVPYDCDSVDKSGKRVPPIPDYVLEILLSKIVEMKGDNITVVFDCCHSASGTRGGKSIIDSDIISRSVELSSSAVYSEQLHQEILEVETGSRGAYAPSKFSGRGLGSHILLSACGSTQEAKENSGHGHFSAALLKLLNQVSPDTLRYSEILRHPLLDRIPDQNPQCEGSNADRILFNAKVLPIQRKSFPILFEEGQKQYIVHGGTIHNITLDSEFVVYRKTDINLSTPIGTLQVDQLRAFSFTPKFPPSATRLDFTLPSIAVQTKFGDQEHLRIYISPNDGFRKIYDDLLKNSELKHHFDTIERVDDPKKAQVELTLTNKNEVKFTMRTEVMGSNQMTMTQVVDGVDHDPHGLASIFSKTAHFYQELRHINKDPTIARSVDVEFYKLKEDYKLNDDTGFQEESLEPDGANLCQNGMIDLLLPDKEAEEIPYGIRFVNKSNLGLHANVFHFSTHDLSIASCATSHNGHTDNGLDIPLEQKGGSLEIGFGTAGYSPICFEISNGSDVDVGFLKIYLSTQSANLAYLPQRTPFTLSRAVKSYVPKPRVSWTDVVIPIILRRHQGASTNLRHN